MPPRGRSSHTGRSDSTMMSDISAQAPSPVSSRIWLRHHQTFMAGSCHGTVIAHNNTASASVLPRTFFIIDPVFVL